MIKQSTKKNVGQTPKTTTRKATNTRSFSTELMIDDKRVRSVRVVWQTLFFAFIVDFLVAQTTTYVLQLSMIIRPIFCDLLRKQLQQV